MKMMLRSQHSFFIVQKIYTRLDSEEDRERVLKLIADNLAHAGDKLIKSKCQSLINKGHALPLHTSETLSERGREEINRLSEKPKKGQKRDSIRTENSGKPLFNSQNSRHDSSDEDY